MRIRAKDGFSNIRAALMGAVICCGFAIAAPYSAEASDALTIVGTTCTATGAVGPFSTIQAAVNDTSTGGTVLVCPGTYHEQVTISTSLALTGPGGTPRAGFVSGAVIIAPPSTGLVANATSLTSGNPIAAQILVQGATNVTVERVTVDGTNNQITGCPSGSVPNLIGIYYQNASGEIYATTERNQKQDPTDAGCQSGLGIFVQSGSGGTSTVTILQNTVHDYQKNGITANEIGTTVNVDGNSVIGQGPTTGAAENGIQIGFGAAGTVSLNSVFNDIYVPSPPPTACTSTFAANAADGILVYGSPSVKVLNNTVSTTQFGIALVSDPGDGFLADGGTVTGNKVSGTEVCDAIDVCSNGNTVSSNTLSNNAQSAIHLDSTSASPSTCSSSGTGNTVKSNVINGACAGILNGPGAAVGTNTYNNTVHTKLTANSCP